MLPPEPLLSFLSGINAGAMKLGEQQIAGDRIGVTAFASSIVSKTGLTARPAFIAQLTNYSNWQEGKSPNFVDWKFFPDSETDSTNLIQAFEDALNDLSNPAVCPATARKMIVLASDGFVNCFDQNQLAADSSLTTGHCAPGASSCDSALAELTAITESSLIQPTRTEADYPTVSSAVPQKIER